MEDFPFAENQQIVDLIFHDIGKAMWAVPVICWGIWRLKSSIGRGDTWAVGRGVFSLVGAFGWIAHLLLAWAIPTDVAVDVAALRVNPVAFAKFNGAGRIGFFQCAVTLSPGRTLEWSARKIYAWDDAAGQRWLWIEGNADESAEIARSLTSASTLLAFSPPSSQTIDAWTSRHTQNRVPLMDRRSGTERANVLLFREPNGYVTPCLLMRL